MLDFLIKLGGGIICGLLVGFAVSKPFNLKGFPQKICVIACTIFVTALAFGINLLDF